MFLHIFLSTARILFVYDILIVTMIVIITIIIIIIIIIIIDLWIQKCNENTDQEL